MEFPIGSRVWYDDNPGTVVGIDSPGSRCVQWDDNDTGWTTTVRVSDLLTDAEHSDLYARYELETEQTRIAETR